SGNQIQMTFTYPTVTTIDTFYTDGDGMLITPEKLEYGKGYSLVEVSAPYGYVLNSDPVYFDITEDNSTEENAVTVVIVEKENAPQMGVINVEKTGEYLASVVDTKDSKRLVYAVGGLAGAEYTVTAAEDIYTPDGTLRYSKDEVVATLVTKEDGKAVTEPLFLGRYHVVETKAPYGMILNPTVQTVELTYAGQEVEITETSTGFYNERQKVEIDLNKVMEQNEVFGVGNNGEITSVNFGLFAAEEIVAADGSSIPAGWVLEVVECDENGYAAFSTDLPVGAKTYVKEISTDKHYVLSDKEYPVVFEYAGQEVATVHITVNDGNEIPNELIYGTIKGYKVNRETGDKISGALFGLFRADETSFTEANALLTAESGEDGVFTFEKVVYGSYTVRELRPAAGYLENETVYAVTVDKDGDVVEITVVNDLIPEIGTTATIDEEKEVCATEVFTLTDTVEYKHLVPGKEYTIKGVLMDKATGEPFLQNGEQITSEVTFVPEAPSGSVEVLFTEDQLQEIFTTLEDVRGRGAEWSDVAILVRGNADGALVAGELLARGYPVVSDDSLYVKSSVTVRRLVSQLSLVDSAPTEGKGEVAGYLARSMDVEIPLNYHSLSELAESILRDLKKADPDTFEAEIPYILSFLDYLREWTETGGNQLGAFLRNWEEAAPRIASPSAGNSIRIMTVHKAKGLEFPFVIMPFAEKVTLYKAPTIWARPRVEGSALEEEAKGLYRVELTKGSAQTFFEEEYLSERQMQAVDAINIFYVALTRPKYGLKVIASPPPASGKFNNMADFLYAFTGSTEYKAGQPFDFSTLEREKSEADELNSGFESYPSDSGCRLRLSPEAADYFGEEGSTGVLASTRIRGNVLHAILGSVTLPEDLPGAVESAILSGDLPLSLKEETLSFLGQRIASVRERDWFSPQVGVRCEASLLSPGGQEHRPDRVVLHPDGRVDIVDYKFGQDQKKYRYQVRDYVNLYRKMGYEKVSGYLWYLEDNLIIFVD
ncbi:MAG: VaFE repeat-containing surface-anchored protein, partial [Bacteroidales bacterium]|nr:VaFE repeat-containing surface-anchored protein [Bacteroidales bacterium]